MNITYGRWAALKPVVSYAEASYFDGYHFQHIATRDEHCRLQRIERAVRGAR